MSDEIRIKKDTLKLIGVVLLGTFFGVLVTWIERGFSNVSQLDVAFTAAAISAVFVAWARRRA